MEIHLSHTSHIKKNRKCAVLRICKRITYAGIIDFAHADAFVSQQWVNYNKSKQVQYAVYTMLGVVVKKYENGTTYVFLCFTESAKDGDDVMKEKHPSVTDFTDMRFQATSY